MPVRRWQLLEYRHVRYPLAKIASPSGRSKSQAAFRTAVDNAAAVAAHHSDIPGLGVDLELNESLEDPLLKMVCRPEEMQRLDRSGTDYFLDKLIFSDKRKPVQMRVAHATAVY